MRLLTGASNALLATLLSAVMFFSSACTKSVVENKRMEKIERTDVVQRTTLNGTLRGLRQSPVQPGYAGYVGKIFVRVGEKVKAGAPLVSVLQTINQPISEVFPIRAPFAGTVTQILLRAGEYVSALSGSGSNSTLLILDDMSEMWIDVSIPEVDIAKVSIGLEARVRANALQGKLYNAVVKTLSLSSKRSTDRWDRGRVEYPAELIVTNPDENLRPGMTVVVDVISAKAENVLAVRHEFVHRERSESFVIDEKNNKHVIELGLSNEEMVEIKSGVTEGLVVKMKDFTQP